MAGLQEVVKNYNKINHYCTWNTIVWDTTSSGHAHFQFGDGIVYREGSCRECGKEVREVYEMVGVFGNGDNQHEEVDLSECQE